MELFDKWHRESRVCKEIVRHFSEKLERERAERDELRDKICELIDINGSKIREIEVLKKIGATGVSGEQHLQVVNECERLKFQNEELTRDFEFLKQRVFDLEQEILRLERQKSAAKTPKSVKDIVVLEDSVPKITSKNPVKRTVKKPVKKTAKSKTSPWLKVR